MTEVSSEIPVREMLGSVLVVFIVLLGIVMFVRPVPEDDVADRSAPVCVAETDEQTQSVCYQDLRLQIQSVKRLTRRGRALLVLSIAVQNVGSDVLYTGPTRFTLQDASGISTWPSQAPESLGLAQPLPTGWLKPGEKRMGEIGFAVHSLDAEFALTLGLGTPEVVRLKLLEEDGNAQDAGRAQPANLGK